ncbi:MAG: 2TM domain-containing protein [Cyclobacteriaceae bacterium]
MRSNIKNQEAYQNAKKRVEAKFGFKIHFLVYVLVSALLVFINLSGSAENLWAKWPLLGWGIGVFAHWLAVFVFSGRSPITDEMIKKEMEKSA